MVHKKPRKIISSSRCISNLTSPQHVDIAHWAGLGGVRYIPADYIDVETEKVLDMSEEDLRLTNQRNMELVATLRNTDSAFSLGEGPPPLNVMCVRFGMVTMETEVEELLSLVINCGKDIDEAVTQLHTMSEVGIQQLVQWFMSQY